MTDPRESKPLAINIIGNWKSKVVIGWVGRNCWCASLAIASTVKWFQIVGPSGPALFYYNIRHGLVWSIGPQPLTPVPLSPRKNNQIGEKERNKRRLLFSQKKFPNPRKISYGGKLYQISFLIISTLFFSLYLYMFVYIYRSGSVFDLRLNFTKFLKFFERTLINCSSFGADFSL